MASSWSLVKGQPKTLIPVSCSGSAQGEKTTRAFVKELKPAGPQPSRREEGGRRRRKSLDLQSTAKLERRFSDLRDILRLRGSSTDNNDQYLSNDHFMNGLNAKQFPKMKYTR